MEYLLGTYLKHFVCIVKPYEGVIYINGYMYRGRMHFDRTT